MRFNLGLLNQNLSSIVTTVSFPAFSEKHLFMGNNANLTSQHNKIYIYIYIFISACKIYLTGGLTRFHEI